MVEGSLENWLDCYLRGENNLNENLSSLLCFMLSVCIVRVGWKHQIHFTLKTYFVVTVEYLFFFSNYILRIPLFLLKERLASLLKHLLSLWCYQHSD